MTGRPEGRNIDRSPPIRLVTRLLAELQAGILSRGIPALDGDLDRFTIYTLIVRQSFARDADGGAIAISAYSLAQSLSRPYETVRRHGQALVAAGLCDKRPDGLVASEQGLRRPAVEALLAGAHDCFVRFVHDLAALELPMPQQRAVGPVPPQLCIEAAADVMLSVADANRGLHSDWAGLVIFSTILCANMHRVTHDPVLAWRHADHRTPVPDALLAPVRAGAVARAIGLSESTVRRRIAAMLDGGQLEKVKGGVVVSQAWLNQPDSVQTSLTSYGNIRRIFERIAASGFPFDAPHTAYRAGRPRDPFA